MSTNGKSRTGLWVVIVLLLLALGVSIVINFGVIMVSALSARAGDMTSGSKPKVKEEWVSGGGDVKVARIAVNGAIMRSQSAGLFGARLDMVEDLKRQIEAATDDDKVAAIILEINSPGGAVTPTDEIYRALLDFKDSREDRRIVTFVRDMAASGSYWLSVAGDWIIAEPTSIVGSIGVILQSVNWAVLSEKIGVTDTTIKSGRNKDLLNPFRQIPQEQRQIIQDMIDSNYDYFKQVILANRPIEAEKLDVVADGRILSSQAALEYGLIDQIGYWKDSTAYTRQLLGQERIQIIRYKQHGNFFELFATATLRELRGLLQTSSPRLMSIWR